VAYADAGSASVPTRPGHPIPITIRMGAAHCPSKIIGFTTEDTEPPEIDTEKMRFQLKDLCALCGEIETVIWSIFDCVYVRAHAFRSGIDDNKSSPMRHGPGSRRRGSAREGFAQSGDKIIDKR
jgi:hypothetical protein